MKPLAKALYNRPVLFAGFINVTAAALSTAEVIPAWIMLPVVAGTAFLAQNFTRPDQPVR